ncbi:hypothetical protein ACQRIU_006463 [Beauveria bassiana]
MSQMGSDTSSGEAVPSSSSASSRRDGSDMTVPATPPIANPHADDSTASSTPHSTNVMDGPPGASQKSAAPWPSSSMTEYAPAPTSSVPHLSSQTLPDSQESASFAGGDTRLDAEMRSNGTTSHGDANGEAGRPLWQLSALAAAQERVDHDDAAAGSRKRMANGEVKTRSRSNSPIKSHARSISAISMGSMGSHISDMSADLKTRLAYAMMKVHNGWQSRSLDEVESLASQAASPASSNSTLPRRQSSSTSPRPPPTSAAQVHFAPNPVESRRKSHSPPIRPGKPSLAPPAPIQPSLSSRSGNSRRNTISRHPPALLTHSHSASATGSYSPRQRLDVGAMPSSQPSRPPEGMIYSPHQNVREQDAIETLLFMSSPNNSSNLRHAFSPSVSPAPQQGLLHETTHRSTPPSAGFRKGLPVQRPAVPQRRGVGLDRSPVMGPPGSPMELDSPQQRQQQQQQQQHQPYRSANTWTPKRRANGASGHLRGALSLPTGLDLSNGRARQRLRDEDIDLILDRAADDSSDDEEIQLPPRRNGVTGAIGI